MKRVCVFCGSSSGSRGVFEQSARALAETLADRDLELVYGGSHVGLMGIAADAVLAHGGRVTGVIPRSMQEREIAHLGLTQLYVVETMHERKALMADLSDAFIAMPGAYGTLDELFEIITWSQLGIHSKPIGVFNVDGFFDSLFQFLDVAVNAGFLKPANRALFVTEREPGALLDRMGEYEPERVQKW